ncbi:hypothetical protein RYX36_032035 [Vicia faba]
MPFPLDLVLPVLFLLVVYFMGWFETQCKTLSPEYSYKFSLHRGSSGTWTCYWGNTTNGLEKGNNFGFTHCHDFHVGWGFLCKESPIFIQYQSFNYQAYMLMPKLQYERTHCTMLSTLMDLKRATTLASLTVTTFMLAGGFFVKNVLYSYFGLSTNLSTTRRMPKLQYERTHCT